MGDLILFINKLDICKKIKEDAEDDDVSDSNKFTLDDTTACLNDRDDDDNGSPDLNEEDCNDSREADDEDYCKR